MQKENKNREQQKMQTTFSKIEKLHPHKMLLYLSIFGSCLIFLFMIIGHISSKPDADDFIRFKFPRAFIVSLVLLLLSSFSISKVLPAYLKDDMKTLKWYLGVTLFLGISFTMSQYIGWYELKQSGIYFSGKAAGSYLYVISGLHILHLAGGLVFLTLMYTHISRIARDPVKTLIMVTNPYERIRIEMLTIYWHFVDIIWVCLFFYFLFSF
jgi:cytochrome c oxidase subunit 3